jgi:hypothetical protein
MARSAVRWLRACGPEPNTTRRCASGSASSSAATADTAAVRIEVSANLSSTASGVSVLPSSSR